MAGFHPFSSACISMDEVLQVHKNGQSFCDCDEGPTCAGGSSAGDLAKPHISCDPSVQCLLQASVPNKERWKDATSPL